MPESAEHDGERWAASPAQMRALAAGLGQLARAAGGAAGGPTIYLSGALGAGKTTFCQGALRGAGCLDPVTSPGYLLVTSHALAPMGALDEATALHVDLYRIAAGAQLHELGLEEAMAESALVLLEWPERADSALPRPDVHVALATDGDSERRRVRWRGMGERGCALSEAWAAWAARTGPV